MLRMDRLSWSVRSGSIVLSTLIPHQEFCNGVPCGLARTGVASLVCWLKPSLHEYAPQRCNYSATAVQRMMSQVEEACQVQVARRRLHHEHGGTPIVSLLQELAIKSS